MIKVFIDGEHGTTGLQIHERLNARQDIELLSLPFADRHNVDLRADYLRAADIAILCLPDNGAKEAVALLEGYSAVRIIDSSTAYRTDDNWVYGFAEMTKGQRQKIIDAHRVSNPGCYATGAISLLRPLTDRGLLRPDYPVTINAVSGYSGGGKQMIAQMENKNNDDHIDAAFFGYGLKLNHKHLPEIKKYGGLAHEPIFTPNVGRFLQGMIINVPLFIPEISKNVNGEDIHHAFDEHYHGQHIIEVASKEEANQKLRVNPEELVNSDALKIYIFENSDLKLINLCAVLDNLGKGASGAAVQNLNLMINGSA